MNNCTRYVRRCWVQPCVLCGAAVAGEPLCRPCAAQLPLLDSRTCRTCALPLAAGDLCGACLKRAPQFDAVRAALAYTFPVDALVCAYKYGGDLPLARTLAQLLATVATDAVDVLVPMPLADERLRQRGFNQACELARKVGRLRNLPVAMDACRKVRHTAPQAALPWSERRRNVRGVFVCDADVTGQRVAIVDDVMTTGATLNELARSIKRAGALAVVGWVVARAFRRDIGVLRSPHAAPSPARAADAGAGPQTPATRD